MHRETRGSLAREGDGHSRPAGMQTAHRRRYQSFAPDLASNKGPSTQSMMAIGLSALWGVKEAW